MYRKFSELSQSEQLHFNSLVTFMKETWNERIEVKLDIVKRFNLDIGDPIVMDFLTGVYVPPAPTPMSVRDDLPPPPKPQPRHENPDRIDPPIPIADIFKELTPSVLDTQAPDVAPAEPTLTAEIEKPKKREMTYANSEDLIVVQNRLLHAISHLTLNERRLILFLSPIIRKQLSSNPNNKTFIIRVEDFMEEYGLKGGSCYSELEKTTISIQKKIIEFWNYDNNGKVKSTVRIGWVTKGEYFKNNGSIALQFHDDVIEMLTVFDKSTGNFWSQYQKEWVVNLGTYGIVMLELVLSSFELNLIENKESTKGYYTVEHLREKFDCIDDYPRFSNFKRYVIDKAIEEIHKNTPIQVFYKVNKIGRTVKGLSFSYIDTSIESLQDDCKHDKSNNKTKEKNPFVNFKMSQKQLSLFATKIKKASGQDVVEIIAELSNVHLQTKHIDFLKVLDFVPSAWYSAEEAKKHPTAEQIAKAKADEKARAKAEKEQKQQQLKQDFKKLVSYADIFVQANLDKVSTTGIEQLYLKNKDYTGIVQVWEHHLLDERERKRFALVDEILAM